MIKMGIIGTGEIVQKFLKQAKQNNKIKINCMYSRTLSKAQQFAKTYNIPNATDDLKVIVKHVNAVYIASPIGLHFTQTKFFLSNNIHVLVEKTMTFTVAQAQEIIALARKNNLILLEAFISVHLPIFAKLKKIVHEVHPEVVNLNFNRTSSRMNMVEKGIYDSVFDQDLGKGSTYDSLVYPLELALYLLGKVVSVKAIATKLPNDVNLANYVILTHENNTITTITCSKGVTSYAPSEFISHDSTVTINSVHPLKGIIVHNKYGSKEYSDDTDRNTLMTYELRDFVKMIISQDYLSRDFWLNHSLMNLKVIAAIIKSESENGVEV